MVVHNATSFSVSRARVVRKNPRPRVVRALAFKPTPASTSSACGVGAKTSVTTVVTTSRSTRQRAFAPSQAPRRVVQVAASGGGFAAGMFEQLRARANAAMAASKAAATSSAAPSLDGVSFTDSAPSWEKLAHRVAELKTKFGQPLEPDLENGPCSPHALVRRFGTTEEPRVLLYRDSAAWCPYCQKIWLQLEEKKIPYRVEKINMRCYGDKKKSFTDKVPSGMLPVVEIDGVVMTESALIASALEEKFPDNNPLVPPKVRQNNYKGCKGVWCLGLMGTRTGGEEEVNQSL